ncbi:hypothetical protein P12x_002188 [Tundrisphaera lichenicola]|uniref:hypothetical protein n=1 Tax=Tundrisphaera lichenicola TaxID=2029860 RepID=UPI003EBA63B9
MPTPSDRSPQTTLIPRPFERAARRSKMLTLFILTSALLAGCGGSGGAPPVDPSRAREALKTTLESWKKGDKIGALREASPPIVAQDFDWMGGHELLDYEVTSEGQDDDANLRIPVKLKLRTPQGKEITKSVSYVVGTSPSLTVFRDFL